MEPASEEPHYLPGLQLALRRQAVAVLLEFFQPTENRVQALRLFARAPFGTEHLLHEVEQEIWEHDPVIIPMDRLAHSDQPVTVIREGDNWIAVALLLAAHVLLRLVQTHHFMRVLEHLGWCGAHGRTCLRCGTVKAALLELLSAPAWARLVSSNLHCV